MTNVQLVQALQASIAPCVLISGDGLLLLSMSNRLSRPIERIRYLCDQIKAHPHKDHQATREQIEILYTRSKLLRSAIGCLICSIAFISSIVLLLFLGTFYNWPFNAFIGILFVLSLVFLLVSTAFFLMDIHWALDSLKIEIRHTQAAQV
ncbi:MAG: DUF2721 domain-containing protein [Candidatus Omnitrophica bacterium]|nr:DUF2721 domain-containing protein [Candidatus Omnitrophota bacterium]MDE2009637.1 DUF2721 domain-containing protein [Candidatus Omnitrophota bacterium]MDE2214435.1 DUF2721 domain-containing protein [Candidatus Omnitrophota bacterium]MDE2231575.1 DUF2721 domain-containing protein [Candidatus Omnitrophota bacterium]